MKRYIIMGALIITHIAMLGAGIFVGFAQTSVHYEKTADQNAADFATMMSQQYRK